MPALNFKEQFAQAVESGAKTQTIRKPRKIKAGDTVQLFTGQRTKQCRRLGTGIVKCISKIDIELVGCERVIYINDVRLHPVHYHDFAKKDGFSFYDDFFAFFDEHYGLPFEGILIKWELQDADT